jgi:glycogen synthase
MRVLITTDSFPPGCGGSGWSTYELARGLRGAGHDVRVVQLRPGARGMLQRAYEDIPVQEHGILAPPLPFVRNYFKNERSYRRLVPVLRAAVRDVRADVVHAQHVLSAPPSVAAARAEGVPVVCTVRDYWPVCYWADLIHDPDSPTLCPACGAAAMRRCIRPRSGAAWPLVLPLVPYMVANLERKRRALSQANAIVAVSTAIARDLRERAPELATTRVETIPNPVDLDLVMRGASAPHPLAGRPYAIYVGKLARNKGVDHLVPAIVRANLAWPLVVVGDGPERPSVEAAASEAGRHVRMLGWLPRAEALAWLAHASLVLFPSYGPESLSRVLLEAGALGRPIAAMDTGGTGDIVVHDRTGLLAQTGEALGDAAARLIADPALADSLGRHAAAFVRERFAAPRVVARIEALYRELCATASTVTGAGKAMERTDG